MLYIHVRTYNIPVQTVQIVSFVREIIGRAEQNYNHDFVTLLQKIMNCLIKRYILKAQRDKDNDEVNEGKFFWATVHGRIT